jgi:TetR/AcrR family transcriptional regulator, transcriptional repressor for nem operon
MHPTRDNLIRIAMRLFAEKGYNSTSVADILQEADVNSGSLYHYFETKQHLLIAVLETYRDHIEEMLIRPAWDGVEDPIDRVFALLARYRELLKATDCLYGCPIGSLALELHEPDPPVRKLLAENFDRWTAFVEGCFDSARDQLPAEANSRALAKFVLTIMEGAVMQSRTYRTLEAFDLSVAVLRDYLSRLNATTRNQNQKKRKTDL